MPGTSTAQSGAQRDKAYGNSQANRDKAVGASRRDNAGRDSVRSARTARALSPDVVAQAATMTSPYRDRLADYRDVGNTGGENFGNMLARMFGFSEMRPQPSVGGTNMQTRANWGFDPAGLVGGALGMATGIPGLGMGADALSRMTGRPFQIGLGPDVFGGPPRAPGATAQHGGGLQAILSALSGRGGGGQPQIPAMASRGF